MNDSTVKFIIKALGADEGVAEINKVAAAAKKAGLTVKQYLGTAAGSQQQLALQTRAATASANQQAAATRTVAAATNRASDSQKNYFAHIAKTTVQSALVNKAFLMMVESMGDAVKQVDLIANFPASMGALGLSTKEASESFAKLRQYVQGVGGDITKASTTVARFAGVTRDIKASTALYAGLNNALIAGGASAEVQASALEQITQAFSRGRPQAIEWKSAMVAMAPQLEQVAQKMGLVNASSLGEALTQGEVSMQDFMTTLAQLGTGTGPIAQQALARMQGIQFAANVMKNALTNGLTAIYQAVGRQTIIGFFNLLTGVIKTLASWAVFLINILISLFNIISKVFGGPQIAHFSGEVADVTENLDNSASSAGDLGDGLDGAANSAKKLSKSLASFDKMNVLPDKESASSGGGGGGGGAAAGGGGGGLDAANAGILDAIFGTLGGKIKEASIWAKILAGIIAGIATVKFAQGIIDQIDGIHKSFKRAGEAFKAFKTGLTNLPVIVAGKFDGVKGAIAGLGKFLTNPYVLLAVAILAVIGALVWLYNTNEKFKKGFDSVWGPIIETFKKVATTIKTELGEALDKLKKKFEEFTKPLKPVFEWVSKKFEEFGKWIKSIAEKFGLLNSPMETFGKVVGVLLAVAVGVALAPFLVIIGGIIAAVSIVIAVVTGVINLIGLIWQGLQAAWAWITNAFQTAWDFVVGIWTSITTFFTGLWASVTAIFLGVWAWLKEWGLTVLAVIAWPFTFMLAIAITVVEAVAGFFSWLWDKISSIWSKVSAWFKANVWDKIVEVFNNVTEWFREKFTAAWDGIVAIWTGVSTWFKTNVWDKVVAIFSVVGGWFKERFDIAWGNIKSVFSTVYEWFKTNVWDKITSIFSSVGEWFGNVFQGARDKVTEAFSGIYEWFKTNVWDKIVSVFSSIGTAVSNAIGTAFKGIINTVLGTVERIVNGFINSINWAIRTINSLPGPDIREVPTVGFPRLARGGVVNQATLAMVGEDGAEAVVPLENNTEWIEKLAAKINSSTGGGQPVQLVVQIGEERIASKLIDLINEKTQMSGRNAIYV